PLLMLQRNSQSSRALGQLRTKGRRQPQRRIRTTTEVFAMLPLVVIYAFAQRSFVRGIAVTGMGG
ncbi:carbohydrate ABC transporter permease, partial [Mycobacterium tuberculosis]|nr:carbohydrate ABC transporter permease [Mycobacterium tuberculosis]